MRKKQLLELSKLAENELKDKTKYIGWGVGTEPHIVAAPPLGLHHTKLFSSI
jgi:hypothetical protein